MTEDLRLAVVGAGVMGANHARVARHLRGATLSMVVDPDLTRARQVAGALSTRATSSTSDIPGNADVAVLAVPTALHEPIAVELAAAGVHLLVEKPLAPTLEAAQRIVDAADSANVHLSVGHVERFNAAVVELPNLLDRPIHIEASRISPYSARVLDGVVFDLMIHDLDIVLSLLGDDVTPVEIAGIGRAVRGATEDLASATVVFSNGVTAVFNTSRLGQQKVRTIEITQNDSVVIADLVRQDVTVHRMSRHEYLADDGVRYRQSSVVEIPFLDARGEPLALELQHVIDAIREGGNPRVSGHDALRALDLATRVASVITRS